MQENKAPTRKHRLIFVLGEGNSQLKDLSIDSLLISNAFVPNDIPGTPISIYERTVEGSDEFIAHWLDHTRENITDFLK